ncbi:MAG: hypothetical protein AABZ60_19100 [Planctomycetota bacterium]
MRMFSLAFFFLLLGCSLDEQMNQLQQENTILKKKLEKTEMKLDLAYRESLKSRIPEGIWLEGNSEINVNQGYIRSIKFDIIGTEKPLFTVKYFSAQKVKPNYSIHFYDRFGRCVGTARSPWKLRSIEENKPHEEKPIEIEDLITQPSFCTITFLK